MILKRCFDIFLSATGILLSLPVWLLITLFIYLEDRGHIFFTQQRVGMFAKLFRAYKFRSMKVGADRLHPNLQASQNDPRVTKVGRFLRATAMDELPQLWNILKGDMSFVGPRALLPSETEIHSPKSDQKILERLFQQRCSVKPGLTGVAQVFAPRDVPRLKKFRYDVFYIRKQSFLFDLKLILLSFWITFRGKWESRENKIGQLKGSNV